MGISIASSSPSEDLHLIPTQSVRINSICYPDHKLQRVKTLLEDKTPLLKGAVIFDHDSWWAYQTHDNNGGECGIRTHGTLSSPTVFKTVALNQTLPTLHGGACGIRTHARYESPNKVATCPLKASWVKLHLACRSERLTPSLITDQTVTWK